MANRFRGEADMAGDSGTTYVLRLGAQALCRLMDEFDEPTDGALFTRLGRELTPEGQTGVNTRILHKILKSSMEPQLNDDEVYAVLDDCGDSVVIEAIGACVNGRVRGLQEKNPRKARKSKQKDPTSGQSDLNKPQP